MIMFLFFVAGVVVALLMFVRHVVHFHGSRPSTVVYYDVTSRTYFTAKE